MEDTYGKMKCPQDPSSTAFSGTCIYWQQDDGDLAHLQHRDEAEDATAADSRNVTDEKGLAKALESVTLG